MCVLQIHWEQHQRNCHEYEQIHKQINKYTTEISVIDQCIVTNMLCCVFFVIRKNLHRQ